MILRIFLPSLAAIQNCRKAPYFPNNNVPWKGAWPIPWNSCKQHACLNTLHFTNKLFLQLHLIQFEVCFAHILTSGCLWSNSQSSLASVKEEPGNQWQPWARCHAGFLLHSFTASMFTSRWDARGCQVAKPRGKISQKWWCQSRPTAKRLKPNHPRSQNMFKQNNLHWF